MSFIFKRKFNIYLGLLIILVNFQVNAQELKKAVECTPRDGLPNFFNKLKSNQNVKIAYLGGSITAQAGWRIYSRKWFQKRFPKAKVSQIYAAIGGTGSTLAAFRLNYDVLRHKPDLIFIEFAVNDDYKKPPVIKRAMEGIVRQVWKANPKTDICFVYTLQRTNREVLRKGKFQRSASAMEDIADYYGIPSIHMGLKVVQLETEGKLIFMGKKGKLKYVSGTKINEKAPKPSKDSPIIFSAHGVHPYIDTGHILYMDAIKRGMVKIEKIKGIKIHKLQKPLLLDNLENAKTFTIENAKKSDAWEKIDPNKRGSLAMRFKRFFPSLWMAEKPGETLEFKFKGTSAFMYDLLGPKCGKLKITFDGKSRIVRRFDRFCTYYRIAQLYLGGSSTNTVHTVKIEILKEQPDKFKILGGKKDFKDYPEKYDGTRWYVGGIQIIGDLIEF